MHRSLQVESISVTGISSSNFSLLGKACNFYHLYPRVMSETSL